MYGFVVMYVINYVGFLVVICELLLSLQPIIFFFWWMAAENLNFHGYILLWSISGIFVNSCFANTSGISQIFCFAMKYINFISDCILFKCRLVINKLH